MGYYSFGPPFGRPILAGLSAHGQNRGASLPMAWVGGAGRIPAAAGDEVEQEAVGEHASGAAN
jgi:hypothetical protein